MTIKLKLLAGGMAVGVMLVVVLILAIYSFGSLSTGFTDIVTKSDTGVSNAKSTEASLDKADKSLTDISKGILGIADDINKTNMTIKVLERKIKQLAETQAGLAEELNDVIEEVPDGIARDTVEDAIDSVGDIEETMRREALISLSTTVGKMASFTENIALRADDISKLAVELHHGRELGAKVVTANEGIKALSIEFGNNIAVSRNMIVIVLIIVLCMTSAAVFLLIRAITIPLNRSIDIADAIAKGDLNQTVDTSAQDEFGQLAKSMSTMISNLKKDIEETQTRAMESTRVRLALDVCRTNVLMADNEQNIIYINQSAKKALVDAEADLQTQVADFNAEEILGSNIADLHPDTEKRQESLQSIDAEMHEDIILGGHSLRTYTNPVLSESGEKLGIAMEFADRTEEVHVEKELAHIVGSASNGNLDERVDLSNKEGFFLALGENMNQLLDVVADVFNNIASVMESMSKGDLSNEITAEYDGTYALVKDAVNSTINNLQDIVLEIRESSDVISVAATEVMSGNTNMSIRTEQQASSLEEIAANAEELTSTVNSNSDKAQTANKLSGDALNQAVTGSDVVGEAIMAMSEINSSSSQISEIIGAIDEIAFQTNLLALNASVEAARAGEHGRGFAVVASEVRNLAQRSASAAKEIKDLISDSEKKVRSGVDLVNHSGETLELITDAVKEVSGYVSDIAKASIEQSGGLEQVSTALKTMDDSTQQNAALAEETSAASESMSEQVEKMEKSLDFFSRG
ncbi:MAG: HAMP domain-containing protein [Bacteroidetes bacterium]|nr:HAMP domain-containing protein [Bacteroidota bacterium]